MSVYTRETRLTGDQEMNVVQSWSIRPGIRTRVHFMVSYGLTWILHRQLVAYNRKILSAKGKNG